MTVSSTSDIEITLWHTWALTVTHEACEYTEQKFNAEKTGGDPVIPSQNLDTDLVMACDQLVDHLIKAYKNPIQMQINVARYSKVISPKDTRHNEEREEKLLERCPPGHEGTKLVEIPTTILDASGAIIAWYVPDALTNATQNQSDPEVSASLKGASSKKILKVIVRPAAIATAALRVMHPEQYWAGLRAFSSLKEKAESKELLKMSETLQYWASMFNSLSVISNRETPNHRDHLSIPECFNILTTVGNYSNAWMSMPSLQLEFRIVRHGVHAVEGDWIAWAWYMRDSVHVYARVPSCGWARVDYKQ
ncbi:uncharacterized protein BJ212DRAFT_1303025 [Suillus subaureus]|uniref:2OGFeDO JBP1/TET oxygenase domain-containing protein n=1 Tax=Suillus subaureus TaxID=48587 RepID=A0A9P7E0Z6_9AGAM|nr:uncharacterized protein BJ212DRAFT_1303025 [Suillus subaureus]KAG1808413.1 hypothetical protein BJ212DRAFT_1303025 [Suillus subaureus]